MWGPVLAWCALQLLADEIDKKRPEQTALDLFDRLRLREPFARALAALGFEGEESWRVAARIKVLLLVSAGIGNESAVGGKQTAHPGTQLEPAAGPVANFKPVAEATAALAATPESSRTYAEKLALPPALWLDPDVRWLCGVHRAEGHEYLIRERYEELLWWLLMPSLLKIAGESVPSQSEVEELSRAVRAVLAAAEAAGYRVDPEPAIPQTAAKTAPAIAPATAPAAAPGKRHDPPPGKKPRKKRIRPGGSDRPKPKN